MEYWKDDKQHGIKVYINEEEEKTRTKLLKLAPGARILPA